MSTKWLVKGLIPDGHAVLLLGQPHNGKSWVAEQLAVCVASGRRLFNEFDVKQGPVVLIDEDTTGNVLEERLDRLTTRVGMRLSDLPIDSRSLTGFYLWDDQKRNDLVTHLNTLPHPKLVVIDSLNKVMLGKNLDRTEGATQATHYWNELKNTGATILMVHHMTLKKSSNYAGFDVTKLAMGNTMLVAGSDTALGVFRLPTDDGSTLFVMKPQERRTKLAVRDPLGVELREDQDQSWAKLVLLDEIPGTPSDAAVRVFPLFRDDKLTLTVDQTIKTIGKDLSEADVRRALHELHDEECLVCETQSGKAHRYEYKVDPGFDNPWALTTSYREALRRRL